MKDKDLKYKEIADELGIDDEAEQKKILRRASVSVILIILLLVVVISFVVYFFELKFGKTAGTVSLIVMAVLIAGYLYKDELLAKIKRK